MSNSIKATTRNLVTAVTNVLDAVGTTAVVGTGVIADATGIAAKGISGAIPTAKAITAATVKFSLGMANADKSVEQVNAMYDDMDLEAMLANIDNKAIEAGQATAKAWNDDTDTKAIAK